MPSIWQQELASAFTCPEQLLNYLNLNSNNFYQHSGFVKTTEDFSFLVTTNYAERIQKGNPNDPLLLQVMPSIKEQLPAPGFISNPVGDLEAITVPGLIHKYHGRVLLITTAACP
nr:EF-P beta-lysylation protein EpmB [Gammaproteobacteria bacterium]